MATPLPTSVQMSVSALAPACLPAILQVHDLSFSYPGRPVFTGWCADIHPGLHWLRGANGSGKSTLLKLLGGALPPLAGRLQVQGVDADTQPLQYRRRVFWCGPGAIAFEHLRAPEYFGFLLDLYPQLDTTALQAHIQGLGLMPFTRPRLRELSTGTQRKVWLAAALAVATPLVLLDEPLNALDAASLAYVHAQLALCAGSATQAWLVASHEALGAAGLDARPLQLQLQQ